jgi:hypothetical protein
MANELQPTTLLLKRGTVPCCVCVLRHALIIHVTNCNKHWKGINLISVAQLTAHVCYQYGSHIMRGTTLVAVCTLRLIFIPDELLLIELAAFAALRLCVSKDLVSNLCFYINMLISQGLWPRFYSSFPSRKSSWNLDHLHWDWSELYLKIQFVPLSKYTASHLILCVFLEALKYVNCILTNCLIGLYCSNTFCSHLQQIKINYKH